MVKGLEFLNILVDRYFVVSILIILFILKSEKLFILVVVVIFFLLFCIFVVKNLGVYEIIL